MARFLLRSKMKFAARRGIFLVGEIASGSIHTGMVVQVKGQARPLVAAPIVGVEFVDHAGGTSQVALHIASDDPTVEEAVDAFCKDGDTIEVVAETP
jgi:hypothetical protein